MTFLERPRKLISTTGFYIPWSCLAVLVLLALGRGALNDRMILLLLDAERQAVGGTDVSLETPLCSARHRQARLLEWDCLFTLFGIGSGRGDRLRDWGELDISRMHKVICVIERQLPPTDSLWCVCATSKWRRSFRNCSSVAPIKNG